jgi:hypothetical protein
VIGDSDINNGVVGLSSAENGVLGFTGANGQNGVDGVDQGPAAVTAYICVV